MEHRIYVLLFILFLMIQSNAVVNVISKIKGTSNIDGLNFYGSAVQGILLIILYMCIELLVNNEYL